jgi:ubiquinone/menaquinone biosynthesis C-methylase UbiE
MSKFTPFLRGRCAWLLAILFGAFPGSTPAQTNDTVPGHPGYIQASQPDPDGIGKVYLGREISHVMGHQGANWLERADREREENSNAIVEALQLKPGEVVADIGAGTGYFSRKLAGKVGAAGRVLAVDIQPEMLAELTQRLGQAGITNVTAVLGTVKDPKLPPASLDLALMVDVYHEFEFPYEMMQAICRAVKPGGRVALVEYRGEDPSIPIKPLHKMTEAQVKKEMTLHALDWIRTDRSFPRQNVILFQKKQP